MVVSTSLAECIWFSWDNPVNKEIPTVQLLRTPGQMGFDAPSEWHKKNHFLSFKKQHGSYD